MRGKQTKNWQNVCNAFRKQTQIRRNRSRFIVADARKALELLPDETIDCIITSPPYGTIKDYGPKNQIGYGQHTSNEYLPDLSRVLAELYRSAKQGAALWVIADNLRSNGAAFPLPW